MEIVTLKVTEVREWENNTRIHTKRNLEALKKSLAEFGQTKPILVQKSSMRIIAGNGTYEAICSLGWETVECRILDLSDEKAEALSIADNRTGELSEWDNRNLISSLKKLEETGCLDFSGFDSLELEKMLIPQGEDLLQGFNPEGYQKPQPSADSFPNVEKECSGKEETNADESDDRFSSYEDQINFVINGFIFSLSNTDEIEELCNLVDVLKDSSEEDRQSVNQSVFESIKNIISERFMR